MNININLKIWEYKTVRGKTKSFLKVFQEKQYIVSECDAKWDLNYCTYKEYSHATHIN
jgi:hypothetical protein